jgi:hypothetical protein
MADNTFLAPLSPIRRSTPAQNLISFQRNEANIYNKFSPYDQAGGDIGPNQPYIYTKLTDSNFQKSLTRYDTRAFPVGSTVRDVIRMTKFSVSGTGLLYAGKQLLLQQQNAFNETRVYNPLSLLKATARPGALGLIDYPQRHLETSGGLLNFFKDALLSTLGIQSKNTTNAPIEGTATGAQGGLAYSLYAGKHGGARAGLLRYKTATSSLATFDTFWVSANNSSNSGGGFLANLAKGFVNKLKSLIPSTNPMGAFGGSAGTTWEFRPEYSKGLKGMYYKFLQDGNGFLTVKTVATPEFYNGKIQNTNPEDKQVTKFHKYYPEYETKISPAAGQVQDNAYADKTSIVQNTVGSSGNNIITKYEKMFSALESFNASDPVQLRTSAERYNRLVDQNNNALPVYSDIPGTSRDVSFSTVSEGPFVKYIREKGEAEYGFTMDNRGFAKASRKMKDVGTADEYNKLTPYDSGYGLKQKRGILPYNISGYADNQSRDIIFFYFYDLINEMYIPFRATLGSIQDSNTGDWDDIKYMGRADKLYVYKGFSREISFNFRVYANSIYELVPNWERVNYLVGLTRPSKYTDRAIATAGQGAGSETDSSGRESGFIYPPMIEFRIGDLYVDQPGILRSVGVTVPDDAQWETLRDDKYTYTYGKEKTITQEKASSRQLPNMVDVAVQLSIIEREQSKTSNYHFGPQAGWSKL